MDPPADKAAVDRLVREHLPGAIRFATRLTGDVDTAEELVQEALVRVARSWRSYRGEARFRTWLWRILVNVFRDSLRARRPAEELTVQLVDQRGIDPAESAENAELGREIARCVSGLPPRQREVAAGEIKPKEGTADGLATKKLVRRGERPQLYLVVQVNLNEERKAPARK